MTGWRIGFAVGNPDALKALNTLKGNVDSKQFAAIALTAGWALNHARNDAALALLKRRRDVLVDGLNGLGWHLEKPKASFYVWVPVPPGHTSATFAKELLENANVLAIPRPRLRPARRRLCADVPDRQRRPERRTPGRSRPAHREAHPASLVGNTNDSTTRITHATIRCWTPLTRRSADRHLLTHPFYQAWQRGELTPRRTRRLRRPVLFSCGGLPDVPLGAAQPHVRRRHAPRPAAKPGGRGGGPPQPPGTLAPIRRRGGGLAAVGSCHGGAAGDTGPGRGF